MEKDPEKEWVKVTLIGSKDSGQSAFSVAYATDDVC